MVLGIVIAHTSDWNITAIYVFVSGIETIISPSLNSFSLLHFWVSF